MVVEAVIDLQDLGFVLEEWYLATFSLILLWFLQVPYSIFSTTELIGSKLSLGPPIFYLYVVI